MDLTLLEPILIGVLLLGAAITLVIVNARRRRPVSQVPASQVQGPQLQGPPLAASQLPVVPAAAAWQTAGPSLAALGMAPQDAETYVRRGRATQSLYLVFRPREGTVRAWIDRPYPGGAIEQFLGAEAELRPGGKAHSDLERFVAGQVGELLAALPHEARLTVTAPEIPGGDAKLGLTSPLAALEHPAMLARALMQLEQAAGSPAAPGAIAALPPAAQAWLAAGPALEQLGLHKQDAQTYVLRLGMATQSLYLTVKIRDATVRAWVERPCPGGALEQFFGAEVELGPGAHDRSPLGQLVSAAVLEAMASLPRAARLTVKAPQMPGDSYKLSLSSPFASPEHVSTVARVLLALDQTAQGQRTGGAGAPLPPVVQAWTEAAPALQALGFRQQDAESFVLRSSMASQSLYVTIQVSEGTIRGWVERPSPGGIFERYLAAEAELGPGEPGSSELAHFVAGRVGELLARLPRGARLKVDAPDIPGDTYKLSLATPFTSPDQAATVARVLMTLDELARAPGR